MKSSRLSVTFDDYDDPDPSERHFPDSPRIPEPKIRKLIDGNGGELARFRRMLNGMTKYSQLRGLTHPENNMVPGAVEHLVENGVPVMIPLAENSGLTYDTLDNLPEARSIFDLDKLEKLLFGYGKHITVVGENSQHTTHEIDEHVGLTTLLAVMNIRSSRK